MLILHSLEIEGFGPFADRQTITFPHEPGVTVIYGANMRGKTSLLNAIRYAFFGSVLGRGSRTRDLHRISNRDRAVDGVYGFSVGLRFGFGPDEYELTRTCQPKDRNSPPSSDEDYEEILILRQDDKVLGPNEKRDVLAHVLPEQVARFFLFDGESLQEYEELLHDESDAGRKISEAIEKILGVPILKRARAHLGALLDDAERAAARNAAKTKETEDIGKALQQASEQKAAHIKEIQESEHILQELYEDKRRAEDYLRTKERYASILGERDRTKERLIEISESLEETESLLQRTMQKGWRTLLGGPVAEARKSLQLEATGDLAPLIARIRRRAVDEGQCPVCERSVGPEHRDRLAETLEVEGDDGSDFSAISPNLNRLAQLGAFKETDVREVATDLFEKALKARIERAHLKENISDLETELGDADVERLRSLGVSLSDVMKKIVAYEDAVNEAKEKVEEIAANIQRLTAKLEGAGSSDLKRSQERANLLQKALTVFDTAIERYKADLRDRVERTATEHFLRMTTEKEDYERLLINPSYGLSIVHRYGGTEHDRSAGAEHVVALGLMGALQNNAPLRGPIVMDSPFGRLDEGHTDNVVRALPKMAHQVVLLIHEGELDRQRVRELLPSALKKEYELKRQSARRTRIDHVRN